MRHALLAFALLAQACSSSAPVPVSAATPAVPASRCVDIAAGPARVARRTTIDLADGIGLSGLDVIAGRLVIVPERRPHLIFHDLSSGVTTSLPVSGIPAGVDVESVAALSRDTLVLGTEAGGERDTEDLLRVRVEADRAVVTDRVAIASGEEGLAFADNAGFEGLCAAGDRVFAAVETVHELDGRRFGSVLAVPTADLRAGAVLVPTLYRIPLSSETGKLSALTCRAGDDGRIHALAIERHFGVARVVRFELGSAPWVEVEVVADLVPLFSHEENFEGITCADGEIVLVNDNDYGGTKGPSEIVVLEPDRSPR